MSQTSSPSRAIMSRILLGVTSIGAAFGILYIFYNQRKKGSTPDSGATSTSSLSRKKKRMSSGEKNRVTFSDQNEIIGIAASTSPTFKKDDLENDGTTVTVEKLETDVFYNEIAKPPEPESSTDASILNSTTLSKQVDAGSSSKNPNDSAAAAVTETEIVKSTATVMLSQNFMSNSNGHELNQQAITPETDYDRTSVTRELRLNRDHIPGLIGRKGSNIKAIQQASNTIINFKDETLDNGDRVCLIRGQAHAVTVAESLIEKYLMEQPVVSSLSMQVPHSSVGRIIGKGGENIRAIQDMSKAKVNVDTNNQFQNRGGGGDIRMVQVTLRGTEEQINSAKEMIIEKVEEEKALRRNIDIITQNRAPRRPANDPSSPGANSSSAVNGNHSTLPSVKSGVLEVFVSCAYHPNDFWIQVMGRESIELDKLTDIMTDWYLQINPEQVPIAVGEIVAAPFDVDGKMYRGKILKLLEDSTVEVCYVDYGDKRIIPVFQVRRIHPEFLRLRFQAIQATLNLGCVGERWFDDAIGKFCDLTYCAQWRALTAKVKDYLKSGDSKETVLWVELLDKDVNIGNELVKLGLATINDPMPSLSGATTHHLSNNSSRKSYAAVAAVVDENPPHSGESSAEGTWDDNVNGN